MIRPGIALLSLLISSSTWAANQSQFAIKGSRQDSNGVTLRTAAGTMRVEVCGDRIVHVVATSRPEIPNPKVHIVTQPCHANNVKVDVGKKDVRLSTAALAVAIDSETGAVSFLSKDGTPLLAEPKAGGKTFDVPSLWEAKTWQVQQTFLSPQDEALYGLGQHQEGLFNLRGVPLRLHQANTNISIPFLLSSKGYGILWNNPSLTDFNPADESVAIDSRTGNGKFTTGPDGTYGFLLTSDNKQQLGLRVNGQELIEMQNMWLPTSVSAALQLKGGTDYEVSAHGGPGGVQLAVRPPQGTTTFRSEVGESIDYYFFYGPDLNRVISDYRQLTGDAPLFPKWAYGYWQCRERYSSQQQILDVATEFRKREIPVDAIVQDWQYWGKYGWNAMKFDEANYPQPKEMLEQLHAKDLHAMISVWSRFGEDTDVYKAMSARSLLIPRTPWTDFFNPEARSAFWSQLKSGIFQDGIDAWWMDATEPEFEVLKGAETFLGRGESVRNAYPLFVTKAIYEGQRATTDKKRVVILTRSAFAGQQRNAAASWSGDISANWATLRRQIPAGLSFSMSGIPYWTTDTGGFFRPTDQYTSDAYHELLIRWFEYGVFCPMFRVHGYQSSTELWNYGPQVEHVLTQYDELRYRLLPYIYSAAWGVTKNGETLMRALPLEFSSDPKTRDISDQFLFGSSLLINPVTTEGATQRSLYLPARSEWIDFWTGKRLRGDQNIAADAPLDRIPIYAKAGAIIPFAPGGPSTSSPAEPLELRLYSGFDGDFTLYEDEGDNYNYERGVYALTPMHWDDKAHKLTIGDRRGSFPGMREHRTFHAVMVGDGHGVGIAPSSKPDATIEYVGKATSVVLQTRP